MDRAVALGATVIGINNRDLGTLAVSLEVTRSLAARAPAGVTLIAESGVRRPADVDQLRHLVDGFLVGTALMRAADPDQATRALVFGSTKVCGLTRPEDALAAARAGATHGGLVFAAESPRVLTLEQARVVRGAAPLHWVGVFVNQEPSWVADRAVALGLQAVQLHGEEGPEVIDRLRPMLPDGCAVWKAVRVADRLPDQLDSGADLVLLDALSAHRRGGTGARFDWSLLASLADRSRIGLSGGLTPENVAAAAQLGMAILDVSTGVESAPGLKDPALLERVFAARRGLARRGPG
jgi:indole-3-glycerol phosphate synthase/phosphoribosylanthranilate isomerase